MSAVIEPETKHCGGCGCDVPEPGARLFSPPIGRKGRSLNRYLCFDCFDAVNAVLRERRAAGVAPQAQNEETQ